jgi:hypothetical protein
MTHQKNVLPLPLAISMVVVPSIHVSFDSIHGWKVVEVGVPRGPGAVEGKGELLVVLVT